MNTISLLPSSKKVQNRHRFFLIMLLSLIIVMIVIYSIMSIYTKGMARRLQSLKTERETIETYIEANSSLFTAHNGIEPLRALIEKAMGKVPNWVEPLTEIEENKPNGVYIDMVKGNYDDQNTLISISGQASNHDSLKAFMDILNDLTNIGEIKYILSRQSVAEDTTTTSLEFEIFVCLRQAEQFQLNHR